MIVAIAHGTITDLTQITIAVVLVLGAIVMGLGRLGWIPLGKRAADYVAEVDIETRRADRIANELALSTAEVAELKRTRTLEPLFPILDRVTKTSVEAAQISAQILDKLQAFNGALRTTNDALVTANALLVKTEASLSETTEGIRIIAEVAKRILNDGHELNRGKP